MSHVNVAGKQSVAAVLNKRASVRAFVVANHQARNRNLTAVDFQIAGISHRQIASADGKRTAVDDNFIFIPEAVRSVERAAVDFQISFDVSVSAGNGQRSAIDKNRAFNGSVLSGRSAAEDERCIGGNRIGKCVRSAHDNHLAVVGAKRIVAAKNKAGVVSGIASPGAGIPVLNARRRGTVSSYDGVLSVDGQNSRLPAGGRGRQSVGGVGGVLRAVQTGNHLVAVGIRYLIRRRQVNRSAVGIERSFRRLDVSVRTQINRTAVEIERRFCADVDCRCVERCRVVDVGQGLRAVGGGIRSCCKFAVPVEGNLSRVVFSFNNSSPGARSNERVSSNGNVGVVVESHRTVTSAGMPLLCVSAEERQTSGCNAGGIANRNDGIDVVAVRIVERSAENVGQNRRIAGHGQIRRSVLAQAQVFRLQIAVAGHRNIRRSSTLVCYIQLSAVGNVLTAGNIDICIRMIGEIRRAVGKEVSARLSEVCRKF